MIKNELLKKVPNNNCKNGLEQLSNCNTKDEMVECFFDRIDYCLANNFPSKELIVKEFSKEAREHHIYIDEEVVIPDVRHSVLLGKCQGKLFAGDFAVCRVYVKHDSELNIKASGQAFILVDALDNANVDVECTDDAKVVVYLYSKATSTGATKTVNKNMETYDL